MNREKTTNKLCKSILNINSNLLNRIIIVDSSDKKRLYNFQNEKIFRLTTKHKNQPYQRFLGYNASKSQYLIFLDDDMKINNRNFLSDCALAFKTKNIVGINLHFDWRSESLEQINSYGQKIFIPNTIRKLLGKPLPEENKYIFCGLKGEKIREKNIEYFNGGSFAVDKKTLYDNFNMQLFDIYKSRLGKGEDAILGYNLSKTGKIFSIEKTYFIHDGTDGSYYDDKLLAHGERLIFIKLYLSCEYYRLNRKSVIWGYVRFHHYAIFQIFGFFLKFIIKPNLFFAKILIGMIKGYLKTISFKYLANFESNKYWEKQLVEDLKKNNCL